MLLDKPSAKPASSRRKKEEERNRIFIDIYGCTTNRHRIWQAKQQLKLQKQALGLQKYEEKVHHLADQNFKTDLDVGMKHNYALFEDVLAKIK